MPMNVTEAWLFCGQTTQDALLQPGQPAANISSPEEAQHAHRCCLEQLQQCLPRMLLVAMQHMQDDCCLLQRLRPRCIIILHTREVKTAATHADGW